MDIRCAKFAFILYMQVAFFLCLCNISVIHIVFHIKYHRFEYKLYSFANNLLIVFQTTFGNNSSDLTNFPGSTQMNINTYFFPTKLAMIYFSTIFIAMIYTWHQTVRLSYCFFALLLITIIICATDLVLISDNILPISQVVCCGLVASFSVLRTIYIPEKIEFTLRFLCESNVSLNDWYEFLQNDTSICARFYQWVKRTKKQWNIEEKLIITTIVALITSTFTIILYLCLAFLFICIKSYM
jgi:hypothetical protein